MIYPYNWSQVAQDRESSPAKDRHSTTVPCHQQSTHLAISITHTSTSLVASAIQ